jgi:hypothetical protein
VGDARLVVAEEALSAKKRARGDQVLLSFDPAAVLRLETGV